MNLLDISIIIFLIIKMESRLHKELFLE